jgi:integrase
VAKQLTALAVENFKATDKRREISDGRGLYLVIQSTGAKSWCLRYRRKADRKARKLTLNGGSLPLAEARAKAAEAMLKVKAGGDPAAEKSGAKAAEKQAAADRAVDTVEKIVADFIRLHAKPKTRSWRTTERVFEKNVLPKWKGRNIHDIKKRDALALLDAIIAAKKPIQANRIFAGLRKFFNWCIQRGVLEVSPCAGIEQPAPERQRDRVLSDAEVVALWRATDGDPAGPLLRMLLLTGQRRAEVSGMRWSEFAEAEDLWSLPPARTKNKRAHIVPLSSQALAIKEAMPQIKGNDFVFAGADRTGYGRAKTRIDKLMPSVGQWQFHDLRRTLATNLQRLGVRLEVTESILNHTAGSRAGIVGVYQRHDWADEKRDALQRWADCLDALVSGRIMRISDWSKLNVTQFPNRRTA